MIMKRVFYPVRGILPFLGGALLALVGADHAWAGGTLTLFSNPTPVNGDLFGFSVAEVGTDKFIVGAPGDDTAGTDAGAAYLFDLSGTLLRTFTSPVPVADENFGAIVTAVGTDKVLISAIQINESIPPTQAGTSYLFDLNGTLLETFSNPNPSNGDFFGVAAALDPDTIVIGSAGDDADAADGGRVYEFAIGGDGNPTQTFSDPTSTASDQFGFPMAALGADRFVAGAQGANTEAGELHVFDVTTGLLVQTLQHPDSTFSLVISVSAFGPDHVLVGSEDFTVGTVAAAGGVFLFDIATGNISLTIENPAPEFDDAFGIDVAALGTGRIAIGADLDNPGGLNNAGTVYLYDGAGALIDTINKPVPVAADEFGFSLAAVGTGALVIGAPSGDSLDSFTGPGEVWVLTDLCPADSNNNGTVNVTDLLALLAKWGPCSAPCPADNTGDGTVNVTDLLALLASWGACP